MKTYLQRLAFGLGGVALLTLSCNAAAVLVINKPDFSDLSDLTLNGSTAVISNPVNFGGQPVLRLTDVTGQSGSAFSTNQISLDGNASFSTFFELQMTDPTGGGADGIVFVVQNVSNTSGGAGGGIGYAGLGTSLGVEFDTFNNGAGLGDSGAGAANHVAIDINGDLSSPLAFADVTPILGQMDQGVPIFAWVDYNGLTDELEVRVAANDSRPTLALLSASVDLPTILGDTDAFVGFTSGTGIASNDHDVRQWFLDSEFNPLDGPPPVVPPVPGVAEPHTTLLMSIGLIGLLVGARRRRLR